MKGDLNMEVTIEELKKKGGLLVEISWKQDIDFGGSLFGQELAKYLDKNIKAPFCLINGAMVIRYEDHNGFEEHINLGNGLPNSIFNYQKFLH